MVCYAIHISEGLIEFSLVIYIPIDIDGSQNSKMEECVQVRCINDTARARAMDLLDQVILQRLFIHQSNDILAHFHSFLNLPSVHGYF